MRSKLFAAREAAAHAVWQSGTIHASTEDLRAMKIHERYPDAPLSPIYFSLRPYGVKDGKLLPEHFEKIGYAMALMAVQEARLFKAGTHTWVTGIPAAGEPILAAMKATIGPRRTERLLEFKLQKTEDETGRKIAGIHPEYQATVPCDGESVILVDDLMTNQHTKLEAINAVSSHGARVSDLLLFLDGSVDGAKILAAQGVRVHSLWTFDHLLDFGLAHNYINRKTYEAIVEYPMELQRYIEAQAA